MKKRHYLYYVFIIILAFSYGIVFITYSVFPYAQVKYIKGIVDNYKYKKDLKLRRSLIYGTSQYRWKQITQYADWPARDGAGAVVFNGYMYLIGGWNPVDREYYPRINSNDVWRSDDGEKWDLIKYNSYYNSTFNSTTDWEGRHAAGYVVHDDHIWIIGGDANQGYHINDIWKSSDGINWNLVSDGTNIPWAPRALHMSFTFNDELYVIGGQTMPAFTQEFQPALDEIYYRDIWKSKDGETWQKVESKGDIFEPRGGAAAIVFKNRIFVIGGFTYENLVTDSKKVYTDIWSSLDGVEWEKHTEVADWAKNGGFIYHDMIVYDEKLWIIGGYKNYDNTNEVWFSEDGISWFEFENSPFPKTHATSLFNFNGGLYVTSGNHMTREVWMLTKE